MNGLIERSLLIDEPYRKGQWHPSAMQAVRLDRCSIEVLVDRGAADASGAGVLLRTRFHEQSQASERASKPSDWRRTCLMAGLLQPPKGEKSEKLGLLS